MDTETMDPKPTPAAPLEDRRGGLCVSRKAGEKVLIGDDIFVQVLEVKGDRARLRIVAPREVRLLRDEVYRRIQAGEVDENPPEEAADEV